MPSEKTFYDFEIICILLDIGALNKCNNTKRDSHTMGNYFLIVLFLLNQAVHLRYASAGFSTAVHGVSEHYVDLPPPARQHSTDSP